MKSISAVLGLHIAAEVLWLANVSEDGALIDEKPDRLQLRGGGLREELALTELEESVESVLRRFEPESVALLKAGSSRTTPPPTRTQRRAWVEASVMMACGRTEHVIVWVTHQRVRAVLGRTPTAQDFQALMAERLATSPPPRWSDRAAAFAAALVAMEDSK